MYRNTEKYILLWDMKLKLFNIMLSSFKKVKKIKNNNNKDKHF